MNFYSASGDGKVKNWTIIKHSLLHTEVLDIKFPKQIQHVIQGVDLGEKITSLKGMRGKFN